MTYEYRASDGSFFEREFVGKVPERIREGGKTYCKHRIVFSGGIHAYTLTGAEAAKVDARSYRQNKRVAEGLAKGTMDPPEGRDTTGDKQSRESVAQFNRMYADKKSELGKPLIK